MTDAATDTCLPSPDFESAARARDRAEDRIANLNKSKDDAHRHLARKLDDCSTDEPCGSGACPRCMRAARIDWINVVAAMVENEWRRP